MDKVVLVNTMIRHLKRDCRMAVTQNGYNEESTNALLRAIATIFFLQYCRLI